MRTVLELLVFPLIVAAIIATWNSKFPRSAKSMAIIVLVCLSFWLAHKMHSSKKKDGGKSTVQTTGDCGINIAGAGNSANTNCTENIK
jgi:hypothetical protein